MLHDPHSLECASSGDLTKSLFAALRQLLSCEEPLQEWSSVAASNQGLCPNRGSVILTLRQLRQATPPLDSQSPLTKLNESDEEVVAGQLQYPTCGEWAEGRGGALWRGGLMADV